MFAGLEDGAVQDKLVRGLALREAAPREADVAVGEVDQLNELVTPGDPFRLRGGCVDVRMIVDLVDQDIAGTGTAAAQQIFRPCGEAPGLARAAVGAGEKFGGGGELHRHAGAADVRLRGRKIVPERGVTAVQRVVDEVAFGRGQRHGQRFTGRQDATRRIEQRRRVQQGALLREVLVDPRRVVGGEPSHPRDLAGVGTAENVIGGPLVPLHVITSGRRFRKLRVQPGDGGRQIGVGEGALAQCEPAVPVETLEGGLGMQAAPEIAAGEGLRGEGPYVPALGVGPVGVPVWPQRTVEVPDRPGHDLTAAVFVKIGAEREDVYIHRVGFHDVEIGPR